MQEGSMSFQLCGGKTNNPDGSIIIAEGKGRKLKELIDDDHKRSICQP